MVYRGHVKSGTIVLDEPAALPEGAEVAVELVQGESPRTTIGQRLMQFSGIAEGLPPDLAQNYDHYLHGQPRRVF